MDSRPSLPELQDFIRRLASISSEKRSVLRDQYIERFSALRNAFQSLHRMQLEMESYSAPRFNLFRLFSIGSYEVSTHSRIIGELLDARGSHAQGRLFLDAFLEMIAQNANSPCSISQISDGSDWIVETERSTHHGNLDICLRSSLASWIIVIENKIYTSDHNEQMRRYENWLNAQEYSCKTLAYLTLDGSPPKEMPNCSIVLLSYKKHIYTWLTSTLPSIRAEAPRVVILQYLDLIRSL